MKSNKRIKRTVAIIAIAACFLLASCGGRDATDKQINLANKYFDLHTIYEDWTNSVVYDKNTGVMYFVVSSGYRFGITPIYNTDGSLKLYDDYEISETEHIVED